MSGRAATRLAWGLCLLAVAVIVLGLLLQALGPGRESRPEQVADMIYLVGFIAVAWCVRKRRRTAPAPPRSCSRRSRRSCWSRPAP